MSDGESRTNHGVIASVEMKKRVVPESGQLPEDMHSQIFTRPGCAEPFAL
jgi:hypothetical protein